MKRRQTKKYYFSVEGETEKWYLNWLAAKINETDSSLYNVSFDCKVQDPIKRVKGLVIQTKTTIYHLSDFEGNEDKYVKDFQNMIDKLNKAQSLGKQVKYIFAYSNLTFDLWIILHKMDCNNVLSNRKSYLTFLNKAFNECFDSMSSYKEETNFTKRILNKLSLNEIIDAIARAEKIIKQKEYNNETPIIYKKRAYFKTNPVTDVYIPIRQILKDCRLYKK